LKGGTWSKDFDDFGGDLGHIPDPVLDHDLDPGRVFDPDPEIKIIGEGFCCLSRSSL